MKNATSALQIASNCWKKRKIIHRMRIKTRTQLFLMRINEFRIHFSCTNDEGNKETCVNDICEIELGLYISRYVKRPISMSNGKMSRHGLGGGEE